MDTAIFKDTKINARVSIELRMEALNVFKHPGFYVTSGTIGHQFSTIRADRGSPGKHSAWNCSLQRG